MYFTELFHGAFRCLFFLAICVGVLLKTCFLFGLIKLQMHDYVKYMKSLDKDWVNVVIVETILLLAYFYRTNLKYPYFSQSMV